MQVSERILNQDAHVGKPPMREVPFRGPIAWDRESLASSDGMIPLDTAARRELDRVVEILRANPLPVQLLVPEEFELPACRAMMARASAELASGPGFVIIDRLPLEDYGVDDARAVYWLLAQLVSRPVSQSWDGKMIYDVRDLGKPPGNGVRPDVTNAEQNFHTDNSYNNVPPHYVGLFCIRSAMEGGVSGIVSFAGGDPCCSYGYYVVVDSSDGVRTLYAHFNTLKVKTGDKVRQGQQLGLIGCTGHCDGPHLHFEVLIDGRRADPMRYLP